MSPTVKKISIVFTLIFFNVIIACLSVRKAERGFVVEMKSKAPAHSASSPDHIRTWQPEPLTQIPEDVRNKLTLSWTAPTTNTDGSPLKDLRGYSVYYGKTKNSLGDKNRKRRDVLQNQTSIEFYNLTSGNWCFDVTVWNTSGIESDFSDGVCENMR